MNRRPMDRKGNMPFALVAVTILLVASSYCAVSAAVKETEDTGDDISREMEVLDGASESARTFVNTGLGSIIYDVCTEPGLGGLSERGRAFQTRSDSWIGFQFPLYSSGVTMRLLEHEISLRTENLRMDGPEGNATPSFLKAVGTAVIEFESDVGKTVRTVDISTDGSCALPLTVTAGSLFSNAAGGEGSALSQMMVYQLTSLAQYRVMNGYGAFSMTGEKGTNAILTEKDVKEAYSAALRALECIYFRDCPGQPFLGNTDLAEKLIADNGRIKIDLNSIYAQALYAEMDNIVGKWFDYFFGNIALQVIDKLGDTLKKAWSSFVSFVKGENQFTAEPYLREVIGDTYTGIYTGRSFSFTANDSASGISRTYSVGYPTVDLYGSDTVRNFKNHYLDNTNSVRNWIVGVVNASIDKVAAGKGMGTVTVDITDTDSFADSLCDAVTKALSRNMRTFEEVTRDTLKHDRLPDQFYGAIFTEILENRDRIFTYEDASFNARIMSEIKEKVRSDFSTGDRTLSSKEAEIIVKNSFLLEENRNVVTDYRNAVDALMGKLDALNRVESNGSSIVQKFCIEMLSAGFFALDCITDVRSVAESMCQEYRKYLDVNPFCGASELPDTETFVLYGDGKAYTEDLTVSGFSSPTASVGRPSSRSSHVTGFSDSSDAPFCTVIPVKLHDTFSYTLSSAGTLAKALGLSDSVYTDVLVIDIETEISVVSGWGLYGVEYTATTNIAKDLYELLLKTLEPLLEPLRKIMQLAETLMDRISQAVGLITQYMDEIVMLIYDAVMGPMEMLQRFVTEKVTEVFCEQVIKVAKGATAIVDVSAVNQKIGFSYMGYTLTFTFNLKSLEKYTKYLVKAEFSGNVGGVDIGAFLNIRTKGEEKKVPYVNAGFSLKGKEWDLSGTLDPTMTTNKNLAKISGTAKGVRVDAVFPTAVQYHEIGIALSDFPGISTVLSNIPSPIAGTKVAIDAGLNLKYNIPIETGVLINEFEPNPAGTDKDNEWAEIINLTATTVDLNDWTLTTSKKKVHIIKDLKLSPGERAVIEFPGTFLVNNKEYLILKDPDGTEVDRSATCSDTSNNGKTCQRVVDGSTKWGLAEGTPGTANQGGIFSRDGVAADIVKETVKKAAVKAMTELRHVYTVEALEELFTRTVKYAIDDGIKMLSNCIVEGTVYVSVDFTDATGSGRTGFKTFVKVDKDFAGDILKYLLGKAEALFLNIADPYNIDIGKVVYDDVYLGISVYGGMKAPARLTAAKTDGKVLMGVDVAANLSAVGGLFGKDLGTPKVKADVGIKNCPYELIPKALGMKKNMEYDYYFMSLTFTALRRCPHNP